MLDRTHTKSFEYFEAGSPAWMSKEAILTLKRGYLLADETPLQMYARLAKAASKYYPNGIGRANQSQLEFLFMNALLAGWLSPASPVASNFGTEDGLPVSCFGIAVQNSIAGIFGGIKEAALLSKYGGGLGADLTNLVGPSNVTTWAGLYDKTAASVSQGGVRRGAIALYLKAGHPDGWAFLNSKDLLIGDPRSKLDCNIAIIFDADFMQLLKSGDSKAVEFTNKVLELRSKYGSPYIQFHENVLEGDPECYKSNGLATAHSQLCNEIFLHSDAQHTYSCVLSSLNLAKWYEWKDYCNFGFTLPMLGIFFLDAVNEEFIRRAQNMQGFERAVSGARKGRPLGLGVVGLHSLYLQSNLPFDDAQAYELNRQVFTELEHQSKEATSILAQELGEPEWCKGFGIRNTHLLAIAPTTTNSVLCNAGSPGIEPCYSMYFTMGGAKGTFERKNMYLQKVLQQRGKDTPDTWSKIRDAKGSVQGLDCLTEHEKKVFRTAYEINQQDIIRQAAHRQLNICQGQSLNLFYTGEAEPQQVIDDFMLAEELGLKGLYYQRGESEMTTVLNPLQDISYIFMRTRDDCSYCQKAKALLDGLNIQYETSYKTEGRVPEIWLNGEQLSDGYNSLVELLGLTPAEASDCVGCDG